MSLNGLEGQAVNQAYQTALTEAGGWLLVKYISRDEVELLGRGTGGYAEAAATVAQYPDKSPLYGFLLYRRRKVIIKYVPDGTSRLLLARLSVHFSAVTDRFKPYDAIFNPTSAAEFTETAISASCSLHAATSLGSSPRQGLGEIAEDAEEYSPVDGESEAPKAFTFDTLETMASQPFASEFGTVVPNYDSQQASYAVSAKEDMLGYDQPLEPVPETVSPVVTPPARDTSAPQLPEVHVSSFQLSMDRMSPRNVPSRGLDSRDSMNEPVSPMSEKSNMFEFAPSLVNDSQEPSHASRPSTSELFKYGLTGMKPKTKLFPRPAEQVPETPNSFRQKLPAGIRMAFQKKEQDRPRSSKSRRFHRSDRSVKDLPTTAEVRSSNLNNTQSAADSRGESIPPASSVPAHEDLKGQSKSDAPSLQQQVHDHSRDTSMQSSNEPFPPFDSPTEETKVMSPEKQRLMKALQLRNQQIRAAAFASVHAGEPKPLETVEESRALSTNTESRKPASLEASDPPAKADSGIDLDGGDESLANGMQPRTPEMLPEMLPEIKESSPLSIPMPERNPVGPSLAGQLESSPIPLTSPESQKGSTMANGVLPSTTADADAIKVSNVQKAAEKKKKRRGVVDPLTIEIPTGESDDEYLSDDSFMQELQSAKVQEAKPVPVPKAPIVATPTDKLGHRRPSNNSVTSIIIKNSAKNSPSRNNPDPKVVVSPTRESMAFANKGNVSSDISRRIRALAEISNREGALSPTYGFHASDVDAPTSLANFRNQSVYSPSRPPSFAPSAITEYRPTSPRLQFSMLPPLKSPRRQPLDTASLYTQYPRHNADNVSVTARIVRDPRSENPLRRMPTDDDVLSLHRSPLIVDQYAPAPGHTRSGSKDYPVPEIPPSVLSSARPISRDSNLTTMTTMTRKSRESTWKSLSRRKNEIRSAPPAAKSMANLTAQEANGDKRQSITSRLYSRMSSLSGGRLRKNSLESNRGLDSISNKSSSPQPVAIGDLNVQFPDSLLWKRRWVEVDGNGNLVLSASKDTQQPQNVTKKYDILEFKPPRVPAAERRELPNSVVLDFIGGSNLQFACEDVIGQNQILRRLKDTHRAWMMYER